MLKLLLDEHISPKVAAGLRTQHPDLIVHSVVHWKDGSLLGKEDAVCLTEAVAYGFTFVTYDQRTIPPLLKVWAEEGRQHAGIIYINRKTFLSSDFGGLIRALSRLIMESADREWTGFTAFLRR